MLNSHLSFLLDLNKQTTTSVKEETISRLRKGAFNTTRISETVQFRGEHILHELYIELTNNCNLSCIFCPRSKITRKKGYMDIKTYRKIIDDAVISNIDSINLHGFGEPLLHPNLIYMIQYAKEKGINNVSFNTNGVLLTEDISLKLIESGLDFIKISIDSIDKEIYKHMRIGADLEKTIKNVSYLVQLKSKQNKLDFKIGIQVMVTNVTFEENVIDYILENIGTSIDIVSYGFLGLRSNSIKGLKELQVAISPEKRKKPCELLMEGYAIYWNGDVTVCCGDFNGEFVFGNINNNSIEELNNNKKLLSFYKIHETKQFEKVPFCDMCDSDCLPSFTYENNKNIIFYL